MKAVRIFTEDYDEAYVVLYRDMRDAGMISGYSTYIPIDKASLEIVNAATFCLNLENAVQDGYSAPWLSIIGWRGPDHKWLRNSEHISGFYAHGNFSIENLLEMVAAPVYPLPDHEAMAIYMSDNRHYYLYMGPDGGGYDVEYKLVIVEVDREALDVLSTIPKLNNAPSWNQAYLDHNANVFLIDGKLWIYPKSGGLLVVDQLTHISGDIAPFSD